MTVGRLALVPFLVGILATAARAEPPSPLWDDVVHPNRLRCLGLVDEGRRTLDSHVPLERERALVVLGEATRLCPRHFEAFSLYGQALVKSSHPASARAALERARQLSPAGDDKDPGLAFHLGVQRAIAGDLEGSLAEYQRALALTAGPDGWLLYYNMGDDLMALGRLSEAIASYTRASRTRPSEPMAHFALAVALDRDGQIERARAALAAGVGRDPNLTRLRSGDYLFVPPADQHYYLGLCHRFLGRAAEARQDLERFLRELPDGPYAFRARELLGR